MNYLNNLIKRNFDKILKLSFYISLLSVILFVYDNGFKNKINDNKWINYVYITSIIFGLITTVIRHIYTKRKIPLTVRIFDLFSLLLFIYVLYRVLFIHSSLWAFTIFLVFIREFSGMHINYGKNVINPARLFIFSFLAIILLGSFLLMLPQATYNGIGYLDALFTSTSAVCVTGLVTLDFSEDFTTFGQSIVLVLIQIGGLGIMTFASYFSYFFRGSSSYQNQLTLSTFTNNNNLGDVFSTMRRIVLITLIIEILGAVLIYFTTSSTQLGDKAIFFSIFHSISAFCNAGFSTLPQGLYNPNFQFDYNLQLIISGLIVFGGLGFPIVYNIYKYFIYKFKNAYRKITGKERVQYRPWLLSINSRITLVTTLSLFLFGFISFFIFEYNSSMSNYDFEGKIVQSIFGSITCSSDTYTVS